MKEISGMTSAELHEYVSGLRSELEDAEEERTFVLGQTGLHVSAASVKRYEAQVSGLQAKIAEAEDAIRAMQEAEE
jgi:hypothetical protein